MDISAHWSLAFKDFEEPSIISAMSDASMEAIPIKLQRGNEVNPMLFQPGNPGSPGRFYKRKSNGKLSDIICADDADIKQFMEEFEWAEYLGDKKDDIPEASNAQGKQPKGHEFMPVF